MEETLLARPSNVYVSTCTLRVLAENNLGPWYFPQQMASLSLGGLLGGLFNGTSVAAVAKSLLGKLACLRRLCAAHLSSGCVAPLACPPTAQRSRVVASTGLGPQACLGSSAFPAWGSCCSWSISQHTSSCVASRAVWRRHVEGRTQQ